MFYWFYMLLICKLILVVCLFSHLLVGYVVLHRENAVFCLYKWSEAMVGIEAYLLDICWLSAALRTPGQTLAASRKSPYLSTGSLDGLQ